ncbi:MAG: class II fructose-bisphosphatase [Peptostreptococcaceae bacterium]
MDRNLALELVRVTETAAIVSSQFMGRGDKNGADGAAVEAMRRAFESVDINGEVVIGEGELDEAPMLYIGEKVGKQKPDSMEVDIAVDPLDGTTLIAKGMQNVISVIAIGEKGSLLKAPDTYMQKIVVGPKAKGSIDLTKSPEENIRAVALALGKKTNQMTISVQDRERHNDIIEAARKLGARIQMFGDGDVATAISTCFEDTGIDMMMGIGGGPEGVITAVAIKSMGGDMQAKIYPLSEQETNRCYEMGFNDEDIAKILTIEDLAKGENLYFAATAITEGDLLKGVKNISGNKIKTQSVVMRCKTGTIRFVDGIHNLNKSEILIELMAKYEVN